MRIGDRSFQTSVPMMDDFKFVVCPAFAESISEGDLRWEKKVGDTIAEDEVSVFNIRPWKFAKYAVGLPPI